MARIPIAPDVAELIGAAAEKVENRSLLLDKFVFHKRWPVESDAEGREVKWDEATRWSFMRIAEGASALLNRDAGNKRDRARGQNVSPENRTRLLAEAQLAESLAKVSWDSRELSSLRVRHTRRFLGLIRGAYSNKSSVTIAQLEGRLAINLADSLIQNAGICLDRLFGLPYIPGSAVKGVCRHAALKELRAALELRRVETQTLVGLFETFRLVFGTSDSDFSQGELREYRDLLAGRDANQKGTIAFLHAYPVNEAKVVVDLTNVHYPDYYRSGRVEDLSKEKPQPNPFPVVEVGAQFAFCLVGYGPGFKPPLLEAATQWLQTALTVQGIGAKTSGGYGWFSLRPDVLEGLAKDERLEAEAATAKARAEEEFRAKAHAEAARSAALPAYEKAREEFSAMNAQDFATAVSGAATLAAEEQRGLLLALLMPDRRDTWKSWKKSDKPANKARVDSLLALANSLGIKLP